MAGADPALTGVPLKLPAARATFFGYRAASALANQLPAPVASLAGRGIGRLMVRLMKGRREMLRRHLRRVHPHLSDAELDAQVRRGFDSYARYWLESFRLPSTSAFELDAGMSYEGLAHLQDGIEAGKGVIIALPHLGGWEFGGAWLATVGYPITVVVEAVDPPELFEWFAAFRRSIGMKIIPLDAAAGGAVLRALRAGEVVCLLSDRDIGRAGIEVDFFGERTTLPAGPATLALRTGAPILPTALYFRPNGGHHGVVRPPIPLDRSGTLREDVARITQLLAHELELLIRQAPDQWHLLQPNWPSDFASGGFAAPDGAP